jgi:hypothetical protein
LFNWHCNQRVNHCTEKEQSYIVQRLQNYNIDFFLSTLKLPLE